MNRIDHSAVGITPSELPSPIDGQVLRSGERQTAAELMGPRYPLECTIAEAMFRAEHPNAEWAPGRASPIWWLRACAVLDALGDAAVQGAAANRVGASWRRGIMHVIERLDITVPPSKRIAKRNAPAALELVRAELDALTELQRQNFPRSYEQVWDVCRADLRRPAGSQHLSPVGEVGAGEAVPTTEQKALP